MMRLRPSRLIAIARRDVAQTMQGRRGLTLKLVTALLLIPAASVPIRLPTQPFEPEQVVVIGDVPDEVLALDGVVRATGDYSNLVFDREGDTRVVMGPSIPPRVRRALDGDTPALIVTRRIPTFPIPGRTALLALISASVLTGGISESIGGERSRKTLQVLLAAAITRGELIVGKWLAWSGYAAIAAYSAATIAIVTGRADFGWWLLPLPMVAAGTVALGLYLVRHASDVVSGAAVSLRVLPALLTITGLVSWYLADISPLAAAALPVGGALLASGSTWPGATAPLVSTFSTALFCAILLWRTASDLEQPARAASSWIQRQRESVGVTGLAALCWWMPITAPLLWGAAGNQGLTDRLPTTPGIVAGALALFAMCGLRMGRVSSPLPSMGIVRPPVWTWVLVPISAVALVVAMHIPGLSLTGLPELVTAAQSRLHAAVQPTGVGLTAALLAVTAQELVFRGWVQRLAGPVVAAIAFVLVITPLEPLYGVLVAVLFGGLTQLCKGSVLPALAARWLGTVAVWAWLAS
jgi:hypothetical protein